MRYLLVIIVLVGITLISACGQEPGDSSGNDVSADSTESSDLVLYAVTEIGVELGDSNYVFGLIRDVTFTPEGNVVILDGQKLSVKLFSKEGEFLAANGRAGEAPGEFQNPQGLASLGLNGIAVTDPFSSEIEIFDNNLNHLTTYSNFAGRAPFVITGTDEGIAGELSGFNRAEGFVSTSVALWEQDTDSVRTYFSIENVFSPEFMLHRIMKPFAALTSDENNIYYSTPNSEEYAVSVFPIDGSESFTLTYPGYVPIAKSDEDLQQDIADYEYRMQAMQAGGRGGRLAGTEYDPPAEYYATASIGIDAEGTIWVQRGWESNPTFDLYVNGETTPTETVFVDPTLNLKGYSFRITPEGIAAYNSNPEDYPKVFILNF